MVESLHSDRLPLPSRHLVAFANFEVDLQAGEIRKAGMRLKLTGQPFQVLAILLEHPGEVVTRKELQNRLWPDTFVDVDHNLNTAINKIREVLGDSAENPRFVETLARRGYRFVAPIAEPKPRVEETQSATLALLGPSPRKHKSWLIAVSAFITAVVLAFLLRPVMPRPRVTASREATNDGLDKTNTEIRSLAVLPLTSLSSDREQDYFTEGMTEALITELGKISAVRVISHQSVMQYKGTKKSVPQIARELNVDAIVEGSIMREGHLVRITTQLIDGRTDRHLWADTYQREMRRILFLQGDVAKVIATEIKIKLTPQEEMLFASARPVNPEAHEAYLKGLYYVNRWPEPEFLHCIESFKQAVEIEPNFADAQAGLATCYTVTPWTLPPKQVFPLAKTAAKEAIRLDANQAEAYAALGTVNMFYEWNWGSAEQNLRRAVELNPNRSYSRVFYSNYFAFLGRKEEAIREAKAAVLVDPTSILTNRNLAFVYQLSHSYPEYAAQAQTTLQLAPNSSVATWDLALALALQGKRNQAAEQLKTGIVIEPLVRALVWATMGENEQAIEALREAGKQSCPCPFDYAMVHALLNENDAAVRDLETAYDLRDAEMVQLYTHPAFDSLRPDSRVQALLHRMNFPK